MSYQLPPLLDEDQFENLIRDIARRVFNDPGIERFGRKGQSQDGIDVFSPADSTLTFQCKLKDVRYKDDEVLRSMLLKEMEGELAKTRGLPQSLSRFVFASTFKNDRDLQEKADSLSTDTLKVEYWGWDTITDRLWEFSEALIPVYYPQVPVRPVHGFKQITPRLIETSRITDQDELNTLALDYYRINDRADVVFRIVCNDIDVRNDRVMDNVLRRLEPWTSSGTVWLLGDGGSGKTTILHRVAVELAEREHSVFMLNLEAHLTQADVELALSIVKFCSTEESAVLCIDNPAADEVTLERILRELPDYSANVQVVLSERAHRYYALLRTGVLTYLHDEEENEPVRVRNPRSQREDVYNKLFDLLRVSEPDREPLREIVRNESLVYVNATYSILLELKRQRKIVFDFDWDDYRKSANDIPAFREGYKFIALFYLFGVKTPFSTFSRICGADDAQQRLFLEKFRGLVNEPIVVDEWRDESSRKITNLRTKHEIVSEIFFREYLTINRDELLMDWCEQTNFADPVETQTLINILGLKKNYLEESSFINCEKLIDFLLNGPLKDEVQNSAKLVGTLNLARFWLLTLREKNVDAIQILEEFVKNTPDDLHCRTELSKAYQKQGRLTDAERILLNILDARPSDLNSRTELAKIYQRQGKLKEAETTLVALLEIDKDNIRGHTEISKVYRAQHRLSDAKMALEKVLSKRPFDINAKTELAKIFQLENNLPEGERLLLDILSRKRMDLNSRTELAKIYQRQGKLPEAEKLLLESLEVDNKQLHSRTELAKIYQRQGKLAEAEKLLLESLEIDDKQLHPRTELAKIYQRQGKLADAEEVLRELLALDHGNLQARTELAKIYQRQGKLAEAEKLLLESLEIDDKQLHPRTELAKIYQRQGKLEEAIQRLKEYIELEPKGLHPRTELAKIYQRQGKLAEAEKLLLESLEIDDKQLHPRTELAKIYQRQGKLADAEKLLIESLEIDDKQLHPRTELAKIYQRQGKFEEAALLTEQILELDPFNDFAMSELLGTWTRQGTREKCRERFYAFIAQPQYKFTRYSQAPVFRFFRCCQKFGMNEEAKFVFERFRSQLDDRNVDFYKTTFER